MNPNAPRILVVDDSLPIRRIASAMLQKLGFAVEQAADGGQALAACSARMPDGILLDWNMPIMDGLTFARALRAAPNGSKPRIIFCTTESKFDKIAIGIEAGADEYIMKPFDIEILASKLTMVGLLAAEAA